MIKKIVNNPWWIFSGWILAVLGFFGIDVSIITGKLPISMATYPWEEALKWILIGGAFWFGVHAYYSSTKYINERKDILDNILILLNHVAKNEDDLKKISGILDKPNYTEMLRKALNINMGT